MRAHFDKALQITRSTSKDVSSIIGIKEHHHNEPHFKDSLSDDGRQACPRCTYVAYNSIAFRTPTRRSMKMICIEEDTGSCIDQVSLYDSLPR